MGFDEYFVSGDFILTEAEYTVQSGKVVRNVAY